MIAVIQTKVSNTNSVLFALDRLGFEYQLTGRARDLENANAVILPGVGHATAGMEALEELGLIEVIPRLEQKVLGVCLGMQLLFDHTEEGGVKGLGVIPGQVRAMTGDRNHPIPHMGWNELTWQKDLRPDIPKQSEFYYFVHSFAVDKSEHTVACFEYLEEYSAIVQKDNFIGIQFHPEKSGPQGELLLKHYLETE